VKQTGLTCRHFGTCGGCSSLDVPYDLQIERKMAAVRDLLAPFLDDVALSFDPPPKPPRYDRIDLLYPIHPGADGLTMGLYQRGSHRVVELEECRLQAPALTTLGQRALGILRASKIPPYREQRQDGILRAFRARYMPGTGELLLGIVCTRGAVRGLDDVAHALADAARGARDPAGRPLDVVGIVQHVHATPGNALLGVDDRELTGRPWQEDEVRVGGMRLRLRVSFSSFYQSHRHADKLLYQRALDLLGPVEGAVCVDGYGGVGAFGVRLLARGASRAFVVENHPTACADAIHNAIAVGSGLEVVRAPFPEADLPRADVMLVDPPRAGLMEAGVAAVLRQPAARLLYVACSTKSLARDLGPLTAAGYTLRAAHLADLFPHTDHAEVVALLER